jgi:hypothetical protein
MEHGVCTFPAFRRMKLNLFISLGKLVSDKIGILGQKSEFRQISKMFKTLGKLLSDKMYSDKINSDKIFSDINESFVKSQSCFPPIPMQANFAKHSSSKLEKNFHF